MKTITFLACFCLVLGCQKAQPPLELPVQPSSMSLEEQEDEKLSFTSLDNAKVIWARKNARLLGKLEADPKNAALLLDLAKTTYNLSIFRPKDGPASFTNAAEYLCRAVEADPTIAKEAETSEAAQAIFYAGACGYSREENDEQCLKMLRRAVDAGWKDLDELNDQPALDRVRQAPAFEAVHEQVKKRFAVEIETLFIANHDFGLDFDLKDTDEQRLTNQHYLGKVMLVPVWGTWCPPCCEGIKVLEIAAAKYKTQGLEVVGINDERQASEEDALELIKLSLDDLGISFPCALGDQKTLSQIPSRIGRPVSMFFDRHGSLKVVVEGRLRRTKLEMIIERLLMDSPPSPAERDSDQRQRTAIECGPS